MIDTSTLPRRTVLAGTTVAAAAAGLSATAEAEGPTARAAAARSRRYFRHGVASGDPMPDRVLLWTRVTPTAASAPGSGRGPDVEVDWEVSTTPDFARVVRRGSFATGPGRDHTVKLDVDGLRPATWYHYRFTYRGVRSRVGRTRTAPAADATPGNLRFGVVSCSNWQAGFFAAYRALARRDDLHGVVHLGDYIYEYAPGEYGLGPDDVDVRKHVPAREMVSLADYRQRHAQYKTDPDLQDAHARHAWIVTWDDHEVTNDQWRGGAENHQADEGSYLVRRARAHRAYDEWMPVRLDGTARLGDGTRLFRRLRFGRLAEFSMLDLRTYRSEPVSTSLPSPAPQPQSGGNDPARTILGGPQRRFLETSLGSREVFWKVIGNPVMVTPVTFGQLPKEIVDRVNAVTGILPADGLPYNVDQWDGYVADRRRVLRYIDDHHVQNALFITGDIHSGWACEVPFDVGTYPLSDSGAVEFVCSSVTSNNLKDITGDASGTASGLVETAILANNRHIKYLDFDSHGFSVLDLTAKRAQMDWYVIADRADRDTAVRWSRSFFTAAGTSRVNEANGPVR